MPLLLAQSHLNSDAELQSLLEADGYEVAIATGWPEVLTHEALADCSQILLDTRLTLGCTRERLVELQRVAPDAAVILIVDDEERSRDDAILALQAVAADYVLRPVHPQLLLVTLANSIRFQELKYWAREARRFQEYGRVLRAVCHESGNCVLSAQFSVDFLALGIPDPSRNQQCLNRLQTALHNLQSLHREVTSFLEPIQLVSAPANLPDLWREAWQLTIARETSFNSAKLHEESDGAAACIVDGPRLCQAFQSLFEDSLAACPPEAVNRLVCTPSGTVEQPEWLIRMTDNRPCMTPELASKFFDPAVALKIGTGRMAVVVAKSILEAHGGELSIAAQPTGATFSLRLPRYLPV